MGGVLVAYGLSLVDHKLWFEIIGVVVYRIVDGMYDNH